MPVAALPYLGHSGFTQAPSAEISFVFLRDGEVTAGPKILRLYRSIGGSMEAALIFLAEDGRSTPVASIDLATSLSQGRWVALGHDPAAPARFRGAFVELTESGTYTFNITSGEGGVASGDPATLPALVKVGGVPASREVVVIEKPSDGQWRLAGYGPTPGGAGSIDVRVTDGSLYAIGLDDWGTVFTADLAVAVDQTIRPSVFTGWLYRITEAGTLPAAEPEWWPAEGDNASRLLGTARAIAVRYYQPLAHGPLPVELL